jgi:hypothetical protein
MKRHLAYFLYVMRLKWYVLISTISLDGSILHAILHDLSKFRPSEWKFYATALFDISGNRRLFETGEFRVARMLHYKRNPHHWQYWILPLDDGSVVPHPIPERDVLAMVIDWLATGKACDGQYNVVEWYEKNKDGLILHVETRKLVEHYIDVIRNIDMFKQKPKPVNHH